VPGNAVLLGEMGIGNTSAAAMLLARLTGSDLVDCVGAGTGLDAAGIARKRDILAQVLARHAGATTPLDALAAFGGFEIAALVGAVLEAAGQRRVIVVDGFITTAAVLVARALDPLVLQRCVFSHRSGSAATA
jgi:nicotinate-nucleotide--dimethylbenzimidazole phosphoribosyltransferase